MIHSKFKYDLFHGSEINMFSVVLWAVQCSCVDNYIYTMCVCAHSASGLMRLSCFVGPFGALPPLGTGGLASFIAPSPFSMCDSLPTLSVHLYT
jgi:hypothetical protein